MHKSVSALTLSAAALLLTAVGPSPARADTCQAYVNAFPTHFYHDTPEWRVPSKGGIQRIEVDIGYVSREDVAGATKITVNRIRFNLDCLPMSDEVAILCLTNHLSCPCDDAGPVMEYLGDSTIVTDCPTTFTTGHAVGTSPNQVVFTPATPIEVPVPNPTGILCHLFFDVRVNEYPTNEPYPGPFGAYQITARSAFEPGDVVCDNGLSTSRSGYGLPLVICPAACDDDDPCTSDCKLNGDCEHTTDGGNCIDDDICTTDICEPGTGACSYVNNTLPCDDLNNCTNTLPCGDPTTCGPTDQCAAGSCVGNPSIDCDDSDPCTIDACEPNASGCRYNPRCYDGDDCTTDVCEPGTGACSVVPNSAPTCSDGDPCSFGDHCETGTCVPTSPHTDCDDSNLCTLDGCNGVGGCIHIDQVSPTCTADSDLCTTETCNPATGMCASLDNSAVCDDSNACTIDTCTPATGGCVSTFQPGTGCPLVSAVAPTVGSSVGGTAVTLLGSGFTGATQVRFGGVAASSLAIVSDTMATVTSPAHSPGQVRVAVVGPTGAVSPEGTSDLFGYSAPVAETTVCNSPACAVQYGTVANTTLTVTGNGCNVCDSKYDVVEEIGNWADLPAGYRYNPKCSSGIEYDAAVIGYQPTNMQGNTVMSMLFNDGGDRPTKSKRLCWKTNTPAARALAVAGARAATDKMLVLKPCKKDPPDPPCILSTTVNPDGSTLVEFVQDGNTASQFSFGPAVPKLKKLKPSAGPVGSMFTIKGKYLDIVATVIVGGIEAAISEQTGAKIVVSVPDAAQTDYVHLTGAFGLVTSEDEFTLH